MSDPQQLASFSPTVRGAISRRVILAAVVATVCVVLANLLALQNPARIVLSQSADHSLSPLTKNVLGALTNDVRAVVLFDRQADLFEPVKNLLTEYERKSPRLKLELIDLAREPARAAEVQQQLQMPLNSPENRVIFAANNSAKCNQRKRTFDPRFLRVHRHARGAPHALRRREIVHVRHRCGDRGSPNQGRLRHRPRRT